jgi:hypothetical protein
MSTRVPPVARTAEGPGVRLLKRICGHPDTCPTSQMSGRTFV